MNVHRFVMGSIDAGSGANHVEPDRRRPVAGGRGES